MFNFNHLSSKDGIVMVGYGIISNEVMLMKNIQLLYDNRELVGYNVLNAIKKSGHTKKSFSNKSGIEIVEINMLTCGCIDNVVDFEEVLTRICKYLESDSIDSLIVESEGFNKYIDSLGCTERPLSKEVKEMYMILDGILNLCDIYY